MKKDGSSVKEALTCMSHLVEICYIHREEPLLNSVEQLELDQREKLAQNSVELD